MVLAGVTRHVRAAAQVSDSARLDRLAGAAASFRDPDLFRAALTLARDRRATEGARKLGLGIAFGEVNPRLIYSVRDRSCRRHRAVPLLLPAKP